MYSVMVTLLVASSKRKIFKCWLTDDDDDNALLLGMKSWEQHHHQLYKGLVFQAIASVTITRPTLSPGWTVDKPGRAIFDVQTSSSDNPRTLNNSIHLTV